MFKISRYFPPVTGIRKFSGRIVANGDEVTITSLLQSMNSAQHICLVTESEFVNYLIQSTSGDAHIYVSDLAELHRQGNITVQDIYDRLTERYFNDLRPNTADLQLRDLNESNHQFSNLQDAIISITKLSHLAARDSNDMRNREAFKNRDFVRAMLNILPKEYKPFILGKIAEEKGQIRGDMTAEDLTRILEIYKVPLDEWFRKISIKNTPHHARIRQIGSESKEQDLFDAIWQEAQIENRNVPGPKQYEGKSPMERNPGEAYDPDKEFEQNNTRKQDDDCKLCGNPKHTARNCIFFPQGKNQIAAYECKICRRGLYHFNKHCPMRDQTKN